MKFRNRLSNRLDATPRGSFVPGQWVWEGPGECRIRNQTAGPGTLLIPDESGQLPGASTAGLRSDFALVPLNASLGTFDTMGAEIRSRANAPTSQWRGLSPLMTLDRGLRDETRLEQTLHRLLGRLEALFHRPRAHLRLDEERQPVARCRRPARRAIAELSRRTEDWAGRRVFGIEPSKVVGLVQEDDLDIYENRVSVHLVPLLEQALRELLDGLEAIVRMADAIRTWAERRGAEDRQDWRRARRIYELFGDSWKDQRLLAKVAERRDSVRSLRRRLLALKSTVLFRTLSNGLRDIRLRSTNLFENDDLYRAAFELRRAWEERRRETELDEGARWKLEQSAALAFFQYSALIVMRALEVLGVKLTDAAMSRPFSRPRSALALNGRLGAAELVIDEDLLEVTVRSESGTDLIRIIPIPARLQAASSPSTLFDDPGATTGTPVIVTYIGDHDPDLLTHLPQILQGPGPAKTPISGTPIAPWEAESIEMLARGLRWHLTHVRFGQYPPAIELPRGFDLPLPKHIVENGPLRYMIEPAPQQSGRREETMLSERAGRLAAERGELAASFEKAKRDPNKALRQKLNHDLKNKRDELDACQKVLSALERASSLLSDLCICPSCLASEAMTVFVGDGKDFKAECGECDTQWGLRQCAKCNERFPWMTPGGSQAETDPQRIHVAYGSDVIAFPSASGGVLCTCCGAPTARSPT